MEELIHVRNIVPQKAFEYVDRSESASWSHGADAYMGLFKFGNNYGASIVRHNFSYGNEQGLFELAVVYFPNGNITEWGLNYETPITNDVIGHLTVGDVDLLLKQISELPVYPLGNADERMH